MVDRPKKSREWDPTSLSSSLDDTVSPTSTCTSTSRMEATPPKLKPSVRASLRHSSSSTRSYGSRPTSPSSSLLVATITPYTSLILWAQEVFGYVRVRDDHFFFFFILLLINFYIIYMRWQDNVAKNCDVNTWLGA